MSVVFTTVNSQAEVSQILDLQSNNLLLALSPEVAKAEGFVTVRHNPEVLWRMNQHSPSIIAKKGDLILGYALIMPPAFAPDVPILEPMFDMLNTLSRDGAPIGQQSRWFVMGQVCIRAGYRGMGIFEGMFLKMKEVCKSDYDFTVTEVALSNTRSLRAHEKVGFKPFFDYKEDLTGEAWRIIILDF
jgi:hypothetical protein